MRISDWSSDVCSSDLIVVAKDKLVDRLRAIVEGIDQRLADGVLERPLGTVADRDADAAELVVRLDVVGAEEEIIFADLFDRRRRPPRIGGPSYLLDVDPMAVLRQIGKASGWERWVHYGSDHG